MVKDKGLRFVCVLFSFVYLYNLQCNSVQSKNRFLELLKDKDFRVQIHKAFEEDQ